MKYFKNTELAKLYHVSEKSVRNWVDAAQAGKLELELFEHNGKWYIANVARNTEAVEQLVAKGKKFKNKRAFKAVEPTAEFYAIYDPQQIFDIASNIEIHREIPHAYSYFNGGAKHWDLYTHRLLKEQTPNPLTKTIELLSLNTAYIDNLLEGHTGANVIDLGVGNCLPVKQLLTHLHGKGMLKRYIGIDTSKDMLAIADQNIKDWFGGQVMLEGHIRNIVYDRFADLVANDPIQGNDSSTLNIVLLLGATILNLRNPDHALRTIASSLGKDDLLIMSLKLDTERARRYFDFAAGDEEPTLDLQEKVILDLLNLDPAFYEVEQFFDEEHLERQIRVRFTVDLSITFRLGNGRKQLDITKGETLLLWRAKHQSAIETIEQLDRTGFTLVQATRSKDQENMLTIAQISLDN